MAEYTAIAQQQVAYLQPIIWTETSIPCDRGLIRHEDGSGLFTLSGAVPASEFANRCPCQGEPTADYLVVCHANIAIPTGGTVEAISLAISLEGEPIGPTTMIVTPAAVEEFFNVSSSVFIDVPKGCCLNIGVRNTSTQPILVQNANLIIERIA